MDYYLKAESEAALWSALEAVGAARKVEVKSEDGEVIETRYSPTEGYNLDLIGTIYKPTGNLIQQTIGEIITEVPEMEAIEGFHANLRGPADLAPKVEYIEYQPTQEELLDSDFVKPEPTKIETPSPLAAILVLPNNPVRVWA